MESFFNNNTTHIIFIPVYLKNRNMQGMFIENIITVSSPKCQPQFHRCWFYAQVSQKITLRPFNVLTRLSLLYQTCTYYENNQTISQKNKKSPARQRNFYLYSYSCCELLNDMKVISTEPRSIKKQCNITLKN